MRRTSGFLGIACAALVAAGGIVAAPAAAAPASPAPPATIHEKAIRLSALLNPKDKLLEAGARAFDTGFAAALKSDSKTAAIFDKNPGLKEAIIAGARPVVLRKMEKDIPGQQQRYARFYSEKFSSAEIDELLAFYSTASGAKMIDGMYRGADFGKLVEAIGKDDKARVTPGALGQLSNSAAEKLLPSFDADDWKALFTFAASPVYAKLNRLMPEFQQLAADIANEPDPATDAAIDKAVEEAATAYLAHKQPKPAS